VGSIPANPDAQIVPSFRRWRFEMKLSPFFCVRHKQSRTIDRSIDWSIVRLRRLQISEKRRLCIGFALGAAFATRQSFSRLSRIDRLIFRLIIFKICRFSNAPFFNLGATDFRDERLARSPRREPSEGCFSEPRLLASHPVCQNSISALFCLQVYHLQCTCQM
jgi:hypothetical protein